MSSSIRKKQTRLSLTPLPSSSPGASGLPEQITNRAAAVRFDAMGSPTKRRRLVLSASTGQRKLDFEAAVSTTKAMTSPDADVAFLPTPAPSSQLDSRQEEIVPSELRKSASSSETEYGIIGSRTRSSRRARPKNNHRRLFSSATKNRNDDEDSDVAGPPLQHSAKPTVLDTSSGESDAPIRPIQAKTIQQDQVQTGKMPVTVSSGEDSNLVVHGSPQQDLQQKQDGLHTPQSSRRKSFPSSSRGLKFLSGGSSGSAPVKRLRKQYIATPTRSSKRASATKQRRSNSSSRSIEPPRQSRQESQADSDDSDDSLMNELKNSARKPKTKPQPNFSGDEDSSDGAVRVSRHRGKRTRRIGPPSTGESETSDSEVSLKEHNARPQNKGNKSEMKPDPVIDTSAAVKPALRTRLKRPDTKKTARDKQLELLRQRRSGKEAVALSSDDDLEIASPNEHPPSGPSGVSDPSEDSDAGQVHQETPQDLDDYEKDFVVEDDDTIGAPAALDDMPLEFTRHANKKPFEHFKDVVEWMIHNKLNPAFARDDQVYRIAVQKCDDLAQGFAGSKFMSAAWKADFLHALKKYPELDSITVPTRFDQKCEACGRSKHPAKHQLIFSGTPYHRNSLESISSDEGSDNDDEQPVGTIYKYVFFLGSTCNANAVTAHALQHWRHALNDYVLEMLRAQGHTSTRKIVEREGWSVKKKQKYANRIVDEMEADGSMHKLYKEFKENIKAARDAKNEVSRYGH
ncbi:MAG: hypothetical protein Q9218_007325 [Villophora microphyllina]